jgi:hypothetical protein
MVIAPLGQIVETGLVLDTNFALYNRDKSANLTVTTTGFSVTGTFATSGVTSFADGTAAAPSIAFTNSASTGFYRVGSNVLGTAIAGVAGLALGASLPTLAAAADTAGSNVYERTADAGASATAARAGGAYNIQTGAGSTGSSGTGTVSGGAGGAIGRTTGAGGAATSTAGAGGGNGGAIADLAGNGGAAAGTSAGGTGGSITSTAGNGGAKTGTGTADGGAGGAWAARGGDGGATASTNAGSVGGAGGDAGLRAGAGGAASAGTANGGNGGGIPLRPGTGGGSAGGTIGTDGIVYVANPSTPVCATGAADQTAATVANGGTISAGQHRGQQVFQDASGGAVTMTTATATALNAALPGLPNGGFIHLHVTSNHATNTSTLSGGTGVTLYGSGAVINTGGTFILRKVSSSAFDLLRVG